MRKLFTLYALLAVLASVGVSCSKEEDNSGNGGNNNGGNNQDKQVVEVIQDDYYKYEETFLAKGIGTMTVFGEASFNKDGICTAVAIRYIYPDASYVQLLWETMRNNEAMLDDLKYFTYDEDKTLTYRFSEETIAKLAQKSKAEVYEYVKTSVQTTIKDNFGV